MEKKTKYFYPDSIVNIREARGFVVSLTGPTVELGEILDKLSEKGHCA